MNCIEFMLCWSCASHYYIMHALLILLLHLQHGCCCYLLYVPLYILATPSPTEQLRDLPEAHLCYDCQGFIYIFLEGGALRLALSSCPSFGGEFEHFGGGGGGGGREGREFSLPPPPPPPPQMEHSCMYTEVEGLELDN